MSDQTLDFDKLKTFVFHVYSQLSGAITSGMIYLGDKLGLYKAMQDAGPLTSEELAHKTGLNERWIREWLRAQAGARLVEYRGEGRFELSAEAGLVLAEENAPVFAAGGFHSLPHQIAILERLPEAFRSGLGLPYDAFGYEGAVGIERFLAPWFRTFLVPLALPALEGVVPRLQRGARVVDIGCGAGIALLEMARAYPKSEFHGYDISEHALQRARQNLTESGLSNVAFHDSRTEPLPEDGSVDLFTSFDCLHDMTHPEEVMRAVRRAIKADGTWLIADINAKDTFEENLERNPMVGMMYGMSVLSCMSSSLSTPDGAGLGTLGFSESVARKMTSEAGFTRFRRHNFDNPTNAYYEVRP